MTPEAYRERWAALRRGPADEGRLHHLARQVALSFMDRALFSGRYESAYVDLLCAMATAPGSDAANRAGASALFGIVIEGLCDDFEDPQTAVYNQVMSQVLGYCRRLPAARGLDRRLTAFGLRTERDIWRRIETLRRRLPRRRIRRSPDRILFLSRMTVGADVAITSVLIQRFESAFPAAELVLAGDPRMEQVFGGHPRLRFRGLEYARRGGLLERFSSWHRLLEVVAQEGGPRTLVVDPDSRLTQLGILPVTDPRRYLFFDSRADAPGGARRSMSELANAWADRVLGRAAPVPPAVWLSEPLRRRGEELVEALRAQGARHLVAVNLGVGGNPRKRVGDRFEARLLTYLLEGPQTVVVLDKGAGEEEIERSGRLLCGLAAAGIPVAHVRPGGDPPRLEGGRGAVGIEGGLGEVAAVIARSDEFVGYDSAFQHIAAALGIPTCVVFAGSNNPRFVHRWRAGGPGRVRVIHVDTLSRSPLFDEEDVVARVASARETP